MNRKDLLICLKDCGAQNDKSRFTRLYIENRISLSIANKFWRDGVALRKFVENRDAISQTKQEP